MPFDCLFYFSGYGKIRFTAPDETEKDAYFDAVTIYDFKEDLINEVYNLDVIPDDEHGYRATLIWIGSKKPDEEDMKLYDIEQKVAKALEPPPNATDLNNNDCFKSKCNYPILYV